MTSDKQVEANRRNAEKSTGPSTPEGKAAVRHNAIRHGLLSRDVLLPEEDETALKELAERLRDELQPVGALEVLLVNRIISSTWRLRRLGRVEAGIAPHSNVRPLAHKDTTFGGCAGHSYGSIVSPSERRSKRKGDKSKE